MPEREPSFPLIPSRRSGSLDVAGHASRRRGGGAEIAGSRPYRRGDAVRLVDWRASARLSTARATDEFVVRDRFAEDAVRVLIVVDRSPSMALFPPSLPWLHKPQVVLEAGRMILASATAAHAQVGYAEPGPAGVSFERPGRDGRLHALVRRRLEAAPPPPVTVSLDQTLQLLARGAGDVPPGTFTFVLSDFLTAPRAITLRTCLARGWDLIPVVVQDPVWESSFPDAAGAMLPLADVAGAGVSLVRLRPSEVRARRAAHEERARTLREGFLGLGLDPVLLTEPEISAIHGAFLSWARARASKSRTRRAG